MSGDIAREAELWLQTEELRAEAAERLQHVLVGATPGPELWWPWGPPDVAWLIVSTRLGETWFGFDGDLWAAYGDSLPARIESREDLAEAQVDAMRRLSYLN